MQRIPVSFVGEFRGVRQASQFVRDGRTIDVPPRLKFEHVAADGEPSLIEFSAGQFDKSTTLDWAKLKPGDRVAIEGVAVLAPRGSDSDSFVTLSSAEVVAAKPANVRAA